MKHMYQGGWQNAINCYEVSHNQAPRPEPPTIVTRTQERFVCRQVSNPLHVGLKVARTAIWAAALTLAAVKVHAV